MHNLTKIKIFRALLWMIYPFALVFLFPFAVCRKRNPSGLFFFFDRYSLGGAQKVHLDILSSVSDVEKVVYFTRKSFDDKLKKEFYSMPATKCYDIHFWTDNLLFRLFTVHYFVFYLNLHKGARILGSNSTFFYDMLPFIKRSLKRFELLHNFTYGKKGMEFFGLANHVFLDKRLVIDAATKKNIEEQYRQFSIDKLYLERVKLVEFGVRIPAVLTKKSDSPLRVLYAGRGGPQKRVWLLNAVSEYFVKHHLEVEFHFVGTMQDELSQATKANCIVHGVVTDEQQLSNIYMQCHVIILTSAYEGFPVVVKEGMAHGCIPVTTALEGIKTHLRHLYNALLINEIADEPRVVELAIENLRLLLSDNTLRHALSDRAYSYAKSNFSKENFMKTYRHILQND